MEKQKQTTYGDLKHRKAELRAELSRGDCSNIEKYHSVSQALRGAELMLLYSITPEESCGELPAQPKENKKARIAQIVVVIVCVVAILVIAFGCQFVSGTGTAIKGLGGDIEWVAEGYMKQMK